jgi:hypothetical protein
MSMTPRAVRWLKMAEEARAMADRMHDPESKRVLLEIASACDQLAIWTANSDANENDADGC